MSVPIQPPLDFGPLGLDYPLDIAGGEAKLPYQSVIQYSSVTLTDRTDAEFLLPRTGAIFCVDLKKCPGPKPS